MTLPTERKRIQTNSVLLIMVKKHAHICGSYFLKFKAIKGKHMYSSLRNTNEALIELLALLFIITDKLYNKPNYSDLYFDQFSLMTYWRTDA